MFIPVAQPDIGEEELEAVVKTVKSGWISSIGQNILEFESKYANYCGLKYGVATSSGTTALHLCLASSGIGPGDEIIVPSLTFVATANAVMYTGAKPVFVDSELQTWNIDPQQIESKINKNTKAIIPVHLYGHPAKMDQILTIARKYNLAVYEDAAEAHGARYKSNRVGSLGDAGCFSFFGNKIITTGEGGMVVTNSKKFAEKMKTLRDHGYSKRRRYYYPWLGFNYRMTNIQAAIGLAQLKKIDNIIAKKKWIAETYEKYLEPIVQMIELSPHESWANSVFWMYSILVPPTSKISRDSLMLKLKEVGIDSRPFFFPIHKYKRFDCRENFKNAEYLASTGINLPSSPSLDESQIQFICDNIIRILG